MESTRDAVSLPYIVGLTGGIASGKTTVSNLFADLGVTVIDADEIARVVVEPGTPALAEIVRAFGGSVLDDAGRLNRRAMRGRVFADAALRKQLEAILHPAIGQEMARRTAQARSPYVIQAIPLLVENTLKVEAAGGGGRIKVDRVLVVDCTEEDQLSRLQARDSSSRDQAEQILAAQVSRQTRLAAADDVITNTGAVADLVPQVTRLHSEYLKAQIDRNVKQVANSQHPPRER